MTQALVAGALVERGLELAVVIDDFGSKLELDQVDAFAEDLARWVRHCAPGATIEFPRLSDFIASETVPATGDALSRPRHPWRVAVDYYGLHNRSLYELLVAIKVLPDQSLNQIRVDPTLVIQALHRNTTDRLLTPLTVWSYLHGLLDSRPTSVVTLGGWDEDPFWKRWREVYGQGVAQLHNPYFRSRSHRSQSARWDKRDDLLRHLEDMKRLKGWDKDGNYVPWLFQNAMLLPTFLARRNAPMAGDIQLRSWASFLAAAEVGEPVLDVLADEIFKFYRGAG
jgi:hypothetical protein